MGQTRERAGPSQGNGWYAFSKSGSNPIDRGTSRARSPKNGSPVNSGCAPGTSTRTASKPSAARSRVVVRATYGSSPTASARSTTAASSSPPDSSGSPSDSAGTVASASKNARVSAGKSAWRPIAAPLLCGRVGTHRPEFGPVLERLRERARRGGGIEVGARPRREAGPVALAMHADRDDGRRCRS